MLSFALLINPVAGSGGVLALKGSDDRAALAAAGADGLAGRGAARAARALAAMGPAVHGVEWLAWGGAMGADVLQAAGIAARVVGTPGAPTTRADTVAAARALAAAGADLLVFCGGDGTARDVLEAIGLGLPVLGIPAGVKMHSGVFATTPEAAGAILVRLVEGGLVRAARADVRDLDEAALGHGEVRPRFHGELRVPEQGAFLQHTKESGRENEALALDEIVAELTERIGAEPGVYILGPGSTLAAVKRALGMQPTLIGIDVFADGRQAGTDVDARWLESWLDDHPGRAPVLVLSFTRQQGFLLGRGNLQLTPAVLRRIGRDRLWVIGTRSKLMTLEGRPLLIDTDDPALDQAWSGLIEVITGYDDRLWYRIAGEGEA
ncbi:MAG: NAD(+)/NADH kinase [Pseudomonadales bacterium]|nr:NAD(+)/NADH kinase [Pseudomonadales bacterium]